MFLCLAIFIAAMLCEYLSKDPKSEAGLVAVIFFVLSVALVIANAHAWRQLHP
jgi:hypothetical protein